jgi:TPR repeat protein
MKRKHSSSFRKVAEAGIPCSSPNLGFIILEGRGVREPAEAEKWLLKAAQQGNSFSSV